MTERRRRARLAAAADRRRRRPERALADSHALVAQADLVGRSPCRCWRSCSRSVVGAIVIILTSSLAPGSTFDIGLPLRAYQALFDGAIGNENGRVIHARPDGAAAARRTGHRPRLQGRPVQHRRPGPVPARCGDCGRRGTRRSATAARWSRSPSRCLAGAVGGALWGFIPGFLKAISGAHEVVTTIMLNFVALAFVSWLITGPLRQPRTRPSRSRPTWAMRRCRYSSAATDTSAS